MLNVGYLAEQGFEPWLHSVVFTSIFLTAKVSCHVRGVCSVTEINIKYSLRQLVKLFSVMGKVNGKGVRKWDLKAWQLLPRQVMEKLKKIKTTVF